MEDAAVHEVVIKISLKVNPSRVESIIRDILNYPIIHNMQVISIKQVPTHKLSVDS